MSDGNQMQYTQAPHQPGEIWNRSFISTIRPTVDTNPLRKQSFSKTLLKPEEFGNVALFLLLGLSSTLIRHENGAFENTDIAFSCGQKTFWKRSFS